MNNIEPLTFTVPLTDEAHRLAQRFSSEQSSITRGKRVYLNTLAVCAVQAYLHYIGRLDIDLTQSECCDSGLTTILDVADLVIPAVGRLECRAVLPGETRIVLPPEVVDDRIGYVAVQFHDRLDQVDLLGFASGDVGEVIELSTLRPIEALVDIAIAAPNPITDLAQILQGRLESGWQTIQSLFSTEENLAYALRTTTSSGVSDFNAGKIINLNVQLRELVVLLLVGVAIESDERIRTRIRVCPTQGEALLPAYLQLLLIDDQGAVLHQVQYPNPMEFIQLPTFRLPRDSRFDVEVALSDARVRETFVV
ncbi:DUF1822 family protein [Leptolyngbya sp. AN03gr2]|uniref:DUF1822 family protein n=1 Tax=unclassified Leptolyngbya TaxID=2650499 RepID=UPI003D3166AD